MADKYMEWKVQHHNFKENANQNYNMLFHSGKKGLL